MVLYAQPKAVFGLDSPACTPKTITFTNTSVSGFSYKWDFGDGQSSTEQHPQHVYAKPDRYVVTLEVTGPDGTAKRSKIWDVQLKN